MSTQLDTLLDAMERNLPLPRPDPSVCFRCERRLTAQTFVGLPADTSVVSAGGGLVKTPEGELLILATGAMYCARCAPGVDICRGCGCTDEAGCPGGCWWAGQGLCSHCEHSEEVPLVHAAQ